MLFNKIEKLCKERGISIAKLEKCCKLGNATIRGWKTAKPSIENLQKVANHFNVSITYFLDDTTQS